MDTKYIKSKPNVLFQLIEKYPNKSWDWYLISENPNITMGMVFLYFRKYIHRYNNSNLISKDIKKSNKLSKWSWCNVSYGPNITMEIIEKYPNNPWDWGRISCSNNLTVDIIEKYHDKDWVWVLYN